MINVNGLSVSRIPINGKETLRIMKNGQQLWSGTGLPAGYTLLEYIESTGTQYIDTEFKANNNTRIVTDCYVVRASGLMNPFGAWDSGKNAFIFLTTDTLDKVYLYYGSQEVTSNFSFTGRHLVDVNKNVLSIDGSNIVTANQETFDGSYDVILFGFNNSGNISNQGSSIRMYSCRIYDNETLVRDYIPCMNPQGVCGLFDKVNRIFYQSVSSSQFTGDYFKEVQYIQSSGQQYIDTGFKPNSNTRLIIDSLLVSNSNEWSCLFGARESDLSKCYSMFATGSGHPTNPSQFYTNVGDKSSTNFITSTYSPLERHVIDSNKNVVSIDGNIVYTHTAMTFQNTINAYIFAVNEGGVVGMQSIMRLYSCQIYDNEVLIRDFIPVKGMVSGTYGLYDKINRQFYPSANSSGFTGA